MNLQYKFQTDIEKAYIIRLENNQNSTNLARRCAESCTEHEIDYEYFPAIDGTSGEIKLSPDQDCQYLKLLRQTNELMTIGELACFLSHYLLWCKCIELDKPIIILEHDAVFIKPIHQHLFFNAIHYLGCIDQTRSLRPFFPIPPHATMPNTNNYRFICRAHGYSIEPMIAKNLVSRAISMGISAPADIFIRMDAFAIIQTDIYVLDFPGETTIKGRKDTTKETNAILQIN